MCDAWKQGKHMYMIPAPVQFLCNDGIDQRKHDGSESIVRRNKGQL